MNNKNIHCKACGHLFTGKFCNNCGEKVYGDQDKNLKHLMEDAFHFFTHFDNKFLKTVKLVLLKPGYLSLQYCGGIRKPFFKPVSLFIICVILYLLFPFFKGLNMRYYTYETAGNTYAPFVAPVIKKKLANNTYSVEQLAERYDQASPKFAKLLILLYLPFTAFALQWLFFRRKKYYFDHFIMATEMNSFYILVGYLIVPLFAYITVWIWPSAVRLFEDGSSFYFVILGMYSMAFAVALKRFYQEKWIWVIPKTILFLWIFLFLIKFVYNVILFYLVMLTL